MWTALGLFWRKSWDNLGHVVLFNFIWFTFLIPFVFSVFIAVRVLYPSEEPPASAQEALVSGNASAALPQGATAGSTDAVLAADAGSAPGGAQKEASPRAFRPSVRGIPAILMLVMSWLVFCAATGFVFYGMADIVTEYDFSGYKFILKIFLRRGPVARSILLLTFFLVTLYVSTRNIDWYLLFAKEKGLVFLLPAGVMLWFVLFLTMTCMLTLPVAAQRDLKAAYAEDAQPASGEGASAQENKPANAGLWSCLKAAAVISLSSPLQTFAALVVTVLIAALGVYTMAGVGFFAMAAPATLLNAYAHVQLGGTARSTPGQDETSLYGSAN